MEGSSGKCVVFLMQGINFEFEKLIGQPYLQFSKLSKRQNFDHICDTWKWGKIGICVKKHKKQVYSPK